MKNKYEKLRKEFCERFPKEMWLAKEGNEVFYFEAKDLEEASMACEMWNAQLIGYSKWIPLYPLSERDERVDFNLKDEPIENGEWIDYVAHTRSMLMK